MDPVTEYWLQRIDAHLERANAHIERGNELFERGNELFERSNELVERNERAFQRFIEADDRNTAAFERNTVAFDRNTAAFERWEAQQDDMHEFMREITARVETSGREHTRAIRRMSDEIVTELRAQRGALLAVLDRLPPGNSDAAA